MEIFCKSYRMNKNFLTLVMFAFCTLLQAQITTTSPAIDSSSNPYGAWSYGYQNTLLGAFAPFANYGTAPGGTIQYWHTSAIPAIGVYFNSTPAPAVAYTTVSLEPNSIALHPGPTGQYAVLRYTAPASANYTITGSWYSEDFAVGATTDVHILNDGTSLFNGLVNGNAPPIYFNEDVLLIAGETINFMVGYGSNNAYQYDMTGLTLSITAVPEPAHYAGLALLTALATATFLEKRRRKQ